MIMMQIVFYSVVFENTVSSLRVLFEMVSDWGVHSDGPLYCGAQ